MSLSSSDPRAAALVAQVNTAVAAIATVQPEASASTTALTAVVALVQIALATAQTLITSLQTTTNPSDATLYLWAVGVAGNLQSYLGSLETFTGQDNGNATMVIGGTTLFHIAAQYLNDWTRAFDIASINGITDPTISVATRIAIPRN